MDDVNKQIDAIVTTSDKIAAPTMAYASPFHFANDLNPYTIMSSGILGQLLTHIKLIKTNYEQWETAFPNSITVKGKLFY